MTYLGMPTGKDAAIAAAQALRDVLSHLNLTDLADEASGERASDAIRMLSHQSSRTLAGERVSASAFQSACDSLRYVLCAVLEDEERADRVVEIIFDSGEDVRYCLAFEEDEYAALRAEEIEFADESSEA